jgi:phage shock protein PspC (stress-responsive transcriptional regulator)
MQRVIVVDLEGQANPYRLQEDAYDALSRYLDQARARLTDDPDQAEVIGDLERSIGTKLADRLGSDDRTLTTEDIEVVLAAVGPVGADDDGPAAVGAGAGERAGGAAGAAGEGRGTATPGAGPRPRHRRLYRIREGQNIAGVCTGLAAYAEMDVGWVRAIFVLLTIFTAGAFLLVYIVMAFVLPVAATQEAWIAAQELD